MAKLPLIELPISPGVMTEETDRGAKGRWKDGDKIRFRQLLPEKLGGWILSSLGTDDGDIDTDEDNTDFNGASVNYGAAATVITMDANVDVLDTDPVWLFGDSKTGGIGIVTIASGGGDGSFLPVTDTNVTAAAGDVVLFEMLDEFSQSQSITAGGLSGDDTITIDAGVTTYLKAGTIVTIALQAGGFHHTTLESTLSGGAMILDLANPLPSDATLTNSVRIYAAGSEFLDPGNDVSYIFRFLANSPGASTQLILTEALPEDVGTADIDIRPFQLTAADGDQAASATLTVTPATDFAITANTPFPDGFIILPSFLQEQDRFLGFCRAVHDWTDLEGQNWAAIGTDEKLYVINDGTLFDITPIRDSGTLIDPFTTTALSRTVSVLDVSHGLQVGDYVRYTGATSPLGGLLLNDEFTVDTVTDSDNYTFLADHPATGSVVSGGGSVSFEYDISIGPSGNVTVSGWGTGLYGEGGWGEGNPLSGILLQARVWSLDNFGEDLLAAPNGGSLYHWDRTNGPTTRAVVVPTAPATIQWMLVSPESRHVIAFGAGTGQQSAPGDADKLLIRWSDQEDFTTWIPSTVNLAGDLRLDVGSEIITAVESRGDIIVNTDESLHAMQFIGGTLVFGLRHLGQSVTVIGPNASRDVNGIVFFMGEDDFLAYDGVLRVLDCDIRNQVFDDLNSAQGRKVFCSINKLFTEIWWLYPDSSSEVNTRYAKYNYKDQVWDYGTIERTAFHDSSGFLDAPYATFDGVIFEHESGVDDTDSDGVAQPMDSFLESWDMEGEEGGTHLVHIDKLVPDFKTLVGSIDVRLKGREYPQSAAQTTKGPYTIISTTAKQDVRMKARQLAIRVESDALGDNWRMGTWRAGTRIKSRRGGS